MILTGIAWTFAFCILLVALNFLYSSLRSSLDAQPPGGLSVYHVVTRNTLLVHQMTGSIYCVYAIITRLEFYNFTK